MGFDADQVFEHIGSYGWFQFMLVGLMTYINMGVDMFTTWDLVCDQSILGTVATSIVFVGWFFGLLFFGTIADKYGRKPMTFISTGMTSGVALISAFSPNFYFYAACRFVIGFGLGGSVLGMYVMAVEFCGIKHRGTGGIATAFGWRLGFVFLSSFAFGIKQWRYLTGALALCGTPVILFWWIVPESPRWLMVEGRETEAKRIFEKIAKFNGRPMPQEDISLTHKKPASSKNGNTMDLFRTWSITKTTLIMFMAWFSTSLLSYGSIFAAVDIGGNMYINSGLIGAITILQPACAILLANKVGRRQTTIFGLVAGSIGAATFIAIPKDLDTSGANVGRIISFIVIRFCTGMAWSGIYIFTAEAYPTMTRNTAIGWCSAMARIGAFASPYAVWLKRINEYLPMGIMGSFPLVAAILCLFQPDTRNMPTLETVVEIDMEDIKRHKHDLEKDEEKNIQNNGHLNEGMEGDTHM